MTIREAIELLLDKMNTKQQFVGGTFAGYGATTGNILMQQRDMNRAIELWETQKDKGGLIQMTATLHAYSNLTDSEYEQIMEALDGENDG